MEIVQRGAEAILYKTERPEGVALVKDRVKKGYRLPELDERIRKQRTSMEARMLERARRAGVDTPRVWGAGDGKITMEWIDGERVKDCLDGMPESGRMELYRLIGESVAKLHGAGLVHGDLTTSNMILKGGKLYIIDFGLGKSSKKVEDQAVDLHLFYEAVRSTHFRLLDEAWENVLKHYRLKYRIANEVLSQVDKIRTRRRYAR